MVDRAASVLPRPEGTSEQPATHLTNGQAEHVVGGINLNDASRLIRLVVQRSWERQDARALQRAVAPSPTPYIVIHRASVSPPPVRVILCYVATSLITGFQRGPPLPIWVPDEQEVRSRSGDFWLYPDLITGRFGSFHTDPNP